MCGAHRHLTVMGLSWTATLGDMQFLSQWDLSSLEASTLHRVCRAVDMAINGGSLAVEFQRSHQ